MTRQQGETAQDVIIQVLQPDTDAFEPAARLHCRCFDDGWSAETLKDLCHVVGTIAVTAQNAPRPKPDATDDASDSDLIGMAIVRTVLDQADLLTIGVSPDHRQRGLGALLLQAAEAGARRFGAEALFLEVAEDNAAAIAMYRKAGYIVAGLRPNYYQAENARGTAVIMQKALTAEEMSRTTLHQAVATEPSLFRSKGY